eukprot:CCRYP_008575-RA/>CCRYP_008575-RA protein AED:0.06 eAED:0.06 QI:1762/1/1/1/1/1/4/20/510
MSAWGQGGSLKSCDSLLKRVEENDSKLVELVILPMKTFGGAELNRLASAIANGSNTNLRSISASGHIVPPESLQRFGSALSFQSKNLAGTSSNGNLSCGITHLSIGAKDMADAGVIALCEGLDDSNGGLIQGLDLGWKNIGKDGVSKIGATFASSKHLADLDLSRNSNIGCKGISSFCNAAKESVGNGGTPFSALKSFTLSNCNIGASGIQALTECLGERGKDDGRFQRIHLDLSSNPIGAEGCQAISLICSKPSLGSVLSILRLSQCSIRDEGICILSRGANANPCTSLTILDLSNNSISHVGAQVFAESLLASWPSLVELNLAKNNLSSAGVINLMNSLQKRSDIESDRLVMSNEAFIQRSDATSEDLGPSNNSNTVLKSLDLTETNCGTDGASAALMSGGLTTLRLFNNKLGSDGFYSLSKLLLGGHPSIQHLDLGGNLADEDSVIALLDAIGTLKDSEARTSKLSVLEIGGNKFGERAETALRRLKTVWPQLDVAHDKPIQEANEE